MSNRECRVRVACVGIVAALAFSLGSIPIATAEPTAAPEASKATQVQPIAATKHAVSLGSCHFQKTPPYEPRVRLECDPGEVVVAVFEDGIRCCQLELR